jgi:hypothetical protein
MSQNTHDDHSLSTLHETGIASMNKNEGKAR